MTAINIENVRDDLILMVSGERVAADIGQYNAVSMERNTKNQIYSAMVVYGLLTYENGKVLVPNKELMDSFWPPESCIGRLWICCSIPRDINTSLLRSVAILPGTFFFSCRL